MNYRCELSRPSSCSPPPARRAVADEACPVGSRYAESKSPIGSRRCRFCNVAGCLEDSRPKSAWQAVRRTRRNARVYHSSMDRRDVMPVDPARHRRLTYDDFVQFPDDGLRHEIIDGEHHVTPSPNLRHQDLVGRLHLSLGGFLEDRPERGRVFLSPFDVVFSFHDVVEPDLVFVAPDQLDILTDKNIQGAPALVVEILSPSTRKRDEQLKRRLYRLLWCTRVLAGESRERHRRRLPARRGWLVPAGGRSHRPRRRHADEPALARMVASAHAVVPLKAGCVPWPPDWSCRAHSRSPTTKRARR